MDNTAPSIGDIAVDAISSMQNSNVPLFQQIGSAVDDTETKLAIKYIEDHLITVIFIIAVIFLAGFFLGRHK
jgi:hypothetical protein